MSSENSPDDTIERMKQFEDLVEHVRVLSQNAQEMERIMQDVRWVAAGGRAAKADLEQLEKLRDACEQTIDGMDDLIESAPDPRELRDQ